MATLLSLTVWCRARGVPCAGQQTNNWAYVHHLRCLWAPDNMHTHGTEKGAIFRSDTCYCPLPIQFGIKLLSIPKYLQDNDLQTNSVEVCVCVCVCVCVRARKTSPGTTTSQLQLLQK